MIPDGRFYKGNIPEGNYALAVCPSNEKQIILDVDVKNGKNGFDHIFDYILSELKETFHYKTKSGGAHYFLNYGGDKLLKNTSTQFGLDLRIGANKQTNNAGGYVKYNGSIPVEEIELLIKDTSKYLNNFLEHLFS